MHIVSVANSISMKKPIPTALTHRLSALIVLFSLCVCGSFWSEPASQKTLSIDREKTTASTQRISAGDLNISFPQENHHYGIATPLFAQLYQTFGEKAIALAGE